MVRAMVWNGQAAQCRGLHRLPSVRRMGTCVWKAYGVALATQPLATQGLTAAVGFALGDASAQVLTGPIKPRLRVKGRVPALHGGGEYRHDWGRMARTAVYGGCIAGPMGHGWFTLLERAILPATPRSLQAVGLKMAVDQMFMAPFGCALYFACMDLMIGRPDAVRASLHDKFQKTLMASYKLWPTAHVINFAIVPLQYRVLYTNLVSVVWTSILSMISAESEQPVVSVAALGVAGQPVQRDEADENGVTNPQVIPLLAAEGGNSHDADLAAGGVSTLHSAPLSSKGKLQLGSEA